MTNIDLDLLNIDNHENLNDGDRDEDEDELNKDEEEENDDCDIQENTKKSIKTLIVEEILKDQLLDRLYRDITSKFIFSLPFVQISKRIDFTEEPIHAEDDDNEYKQISNDNAGLNLKLQMKQSMFVLEDSRIEGDDDEKNESQNDLETFIDKKIN